MTKCHGSIPGTAHPKGDVSTIPTTMQEKMLRIMPREKPYHISFLGEDKILPDIQMKAAKNKTADIIPRIPSSHHS